MHACPTCRHELPDDALFCPRDGTTLARARVGGADDPLIGRVLDGRYLVRAPLGAGGVGVIYEGEHIEIKKQVAIKVLHGMFADTDEFRRRFEREARTASRLSHPGCVSVLDFGRVTRVEPQAGAAALFGMLYLVMEFVRGRSLFERLHEGAPLAPPEAVHIAVGVLAALRHAHGLGLVHRDIKPANIMLVDEGGVVAPKLLDFGLARDLHSDDSGPVTQSGTVFGTPSYVSPEQAAGKPADPRSDLYALGVVLFEMVCGRRPFVREDPLDTVRDHLETPPPSPRALGVAISPALEAALATALAKDPAQRFASAAAFAGALGKTPEGVAATAKVKESGRLATAALRPATPASTTTPVSATASAATPVSKSATPALATPVSTRETPISTTETPASAPWSARAARGRAAARLASYLSSLSVRGRAVAAAGTLVVLAGLVLAVAPHRRPAPPAPLPPAPVVAAPTAASRVLALLAANQLDDAVAAARAQLGKEPHDGRTRAALAVAYQRKLWCSDALEELDHALRDAPELRRDASLPRCAIACLGPKTRDKAARFLVDKLGRDAVPALREAAAGDGNGEVRRGAERALELLRAAP